MMETGQEQDRKPGIILSQGVCRGLLALGLAPLTEMPLASGQRMDVCALSAEGEVWCVEVKSSRADFLADAKWRGYLAWCDRFFFAVPEGFPDALLPAEHGLIRADAWDAAVLRPAPLARLASARRRALTLRFARLAAARLSAT